MDHLGELLNVIGAGSVLEKMRMHGTKCSRLLLKVIALALLHELIEDIGGRGYSIIADESTDVSVIKYLAFCVRYYSAAKDDIVTDFLSFVEVSTATGKALADATLGYLRKVGLDPQKMIGFGSDNAANMTGVDHGCFKYLKDEVRTL